MEDATSPIDTLPVGAEFRKCAFQVNPHHYASTYRGMSHGLDEEAYAAQLFDKAN